MELYNNPASEFVAGFIGSPKMNFVSGPYAERMGASRIGIRPEHFEVGDGENAWEGEVSLVERLGHDTVLYVRVPEAGSLTVSLSGQHPQSVGDRVRLMPRPDHLHRFDAEGRPMAR